MNKQVKLFFILFVSSLLLGFTSCNDDDDDDNNYAKEIAGTYVGTATALEQEIPNVEIKMTRESNNKVKLALKQVINEVVGEIDIQLVGTVTYLNNTYAIAGVATVPFQYGSFPAVDLPVEVVGTIDSKGNADLGIIVGKGMNLEFGAMKLPMTVAYEGQRQ